MSIDLAVDFCPSCGTRYSTEAKFCRGCGLELANARAQAQARREQEAAREAELARQRREKIDQAKAFVWGTPRRKATSLVLLLTVVVAGLGLHYYLLPDEIGERMLWSQDAASASTALNCNDQNCLVEQMRAHAASEKTIDLAKKLTTLTGTPSWAVGLMRFPGKVSLLSYDCALSGCYRHGGFALVNGDPQIILDASGRTPLSDSPVVKSWINQFAPGSFLTYYYGFDRAVPSPSGGQRFVFFDTVAECEACEPKGAVEYYFGFDDAGRLVDQGPYGWVPFIPKGVWPPGR